MYKIKEITQKRNWENFLTKEYTGFYPFFQSWDWGEVQTATHHPCIRLGLYKNEQLAGIVLITDINAKRGHYLHLRHGPVLLTYDDGSFDYLFDYVKSLAKDKQASFIRISPLIKKEIRNGTFFKERGFRESLMHSMDAELCWVLDITVEENTLLKNMRKSHRYLIKKALALSELSIIKTKNENDFKNFLPLYKDLAHRKHFIPHSGVQEEFSILGKNNEMELYLAQFQGNIIAGAMIAYIGNMAVYRHSAMNEQFKHIPASYLIQWKAIQEAKKRGKNLYNFYGIAPEGTLHHPWAGLTLFKTGFGGYREEFIHAMDYPLTPWYWKNYLVDWVSKRKKGY